MKAGSPFSTWEDLLKAEKAVVGTSAVRRIAQLQGKYPNLTFMDIRGNLNTRLKKLDDPEGPYDAIILAKAGIMRLDWQHRIHRVHLLISILSSNPTIISIFFTGVAPGWVPSRCWTGRSCRRMQSGWFGSSAVAEGTKSQRYCVVCDGWTSLDAEDGKLDSTNSQSCIEIKVIFIGRWVFGPFGCSCRIAKWSSTSYWSRCLEPRRKMFC